MHIVHQAQPQTTHYFVPVTWHPNGQALIASIGAYTYGNFSIEQAGAFFNGELNQVHIGKYCSIAKEVYFLSGSEHHLEWGTTYPFSHFPAEWTELRTIQDDPCAYGPIIVQNDVWIGQGVLIRSGVTVGHGAIIGMGAVVTKDVPPYSIVGGIPAKVIKYRFEHKVIGMLLDMAWWDLPDTIVRQIAPLLCQPMTLEVCLNLKQKIEHLTSQLT